MLGSYGQPMGEYGMAPYSSGVPGEASYAPQAYTQSNFTQSSQSISQSSMYSQGMSHTQGTLTQGSQPMTVSLSQESFIDDFKSQESYQDRSQDFSSQF